MPQFLVIGKKSEKKEYETHRQIIKNEAFNDFLRHQEFVRTGNIPDWYKVHSGWYATLNKCPTVIDYYYHEIGELKKQISIRKKRGYYDKFFVVGESRRRKNKAAISKFSKDFDDVRIVTVKEYQKLKSKKGAENVITTSS